MARFFTPGQQYYLQHQPAFTVWAKRCWSWQGAWIFVTILAFVLGFMAWTLLFSRPTCVQKMHDLMEVQISQEDAWFCLDGRLRSANPDKNNWFARQGQDVTIDYAARSLSGEWLVVYGITYTDRRDRAFITLDHEGYVSSVVTK